MNVIRTYFATATATVTETDMERWKSGINIVKLRVCVSPVALVLSRPA